MSSVLDFHQYRSQATPIRFPSVQIPNHTYGAMYCDDVCDHPPPGLTPYGLGMYTFHWVTMYGRRRDNSEYNTQMTTNFTGRYFTTFHKVS